MCICQFCLIMKMIMYSLGFFFFNLHTSLSEICIINPKVEDNKLVFYQSICTDNPSLFTPLQDRQKVHIGAS